MSKHAQKQWKDIGGFYHDTATEARTASRAEEIRRAMQVTYKARNSTGINWFLSDPEGIIAEYRAICAEVDEGMAATKD